MPNINEKRSQKDHDGKDNGEMMITSLTMMMVNRFKALNENPRDQGRKDDKLRLLVQEAVCLLPPTLNPNTRTHSRLLRSNKSLFVSDTTTREVEERYRR